MGYGPRYLHSIGQLYKGGANNGVFLMITADGDNYLKVPGKEYSFNDIVNAQALGDFKALSEAGRRVIRIHFSKKDYFHKYKDGLDILKLHFWDTW